MLTTRLSDLEALWALVGSALDPHEWLWVIIALTGMVTSALLLVICIGLTLRLYRVESPQHWQVLR